jgi:hypothetical protein
MFALSAMKPSLSDFNMFKKKKEKNWLIKNSLGLRTRILRKYDAVGLNQINWALLRLKD